MNTLANHAPSLLGRTLRRLATLAVLLSGLLTGPAQAGILYFDPNGNQLGTGIINGGTYAWDGPFWAGNSGGTQGVGYWVPGSMAGFYGGTGGDVYTVVMTNAELTIGLYDAASDLNLTLSASGNGQLQLASGLQGIYCAGSIQITAPITGSGGLAPESNGLLYLYGTNTYAGGTQFGMSGSTLVFFNNNSSFGTGPLTLGTLTLLAATDATAPLTITNSIQAATGSFVFRGATAAPVTWTSPWALPPGNLAFQVANVGTQSSKMLLQGPVSGAGAGLSKSGTGTLVLAANNTYDGNTTLSSGTLEIAGSILGNVTNTGGVLQLDRPTVLSSTAVVALSSSLPPGSLVLPFSGAQTIQALTIDGVGQPAGTWGGAGSGASYTNALFANIGKFLVVGPPAITQQPQSRSVYPDATCSFTVAVTGDPSFTYQWKFNGTDLPGATASSLTVTPAEAPNAGTYSCWITNNYGWTNTVDATLTLLSTNWYPGNILPEHPIAYWRLDETNGVLANDWVGGNVGLYQNVLLNQPGAALGDPDPAIALPADPTRRGYVQVTNYAPFSFPHAAPFTLEGWAFFTNLTGAQRLLSTLRMGPPYGWAFGIYGADRVRFTAGGLQDADAVLSTPLVTGVWYYLVCTCDGYNYHLYVDGQEIGTGVPILSGGVTGVSNPLTLGCNPTNFTYHTTGDPLAEQLQGKLDEVAIYDYALSASQILKHWYRPLPTWPKVTWPTPKPIPYGTALSSNQLNATADTPGTFYYTPPAGTVPDAGTNYLSLLFSPNNRDLYRFVSTGQLLVVYPAPLSAKADDATRLYGQTNPAFTGTLTGVLNGDNLTATYSSPATPDSPPGVYPIIPNLVDPDGRLGNYVVITNYGALTVAGPPVISGFSYAASATNPVTGARSLTLSAWVNPGSADTVAWFQYGLDTTYAGSSGPATLAAGTTPSLISANLDAVVPGALYHCRVGASNSFGLSYSADQVVTLPALFVPGDLNGDGVVDAGELHAVLTNYWPNSPWLGLTNTLGLGSTQVQFNLTNTSDWTFSVLMSTNLQDWEYLGPANPLFQFTDPAATNSPTRFYRLRWP